MANNQNSYVRGANKKAMLAKLSSRMDTKGDWKHSGYELGKDLLFGVIGGGVLAAVIGKPAFLAGVGVTYVGHYAGNPLVSTVGLSMMASGVGSATAAVNGLDGLDGVKERVQAFKESILERTYLDKVIPKKAATVNGTVGELQYFNYGQMAGASDNPELYGDMSGLAALNEIEQSIADAGMARLQGAGSVGTLQTELEGGDMGYADVSDYNF